RSRRSPRRGCARGRARRSSLGGQLGEDRRGVEIDALADQPFALEEEERDAAALERTPGRLEAAQRPLVGPAQPELRDHRVVGVMESDQLVALVRERAARVAEVL